jgi:hypothetical protein
MLRPTPKEVIAGIQRTITGVLAPELQSPFAISQAGTAAAVLMMASEWIESFPKHNAAETEDLKQTFDSLRPHGDTGIIEAAGFREAIESGVQASDEEPPDLHGMEAAMSELAGGVALKRIAGPVADEVRDYLKRHIERLKLLFGTSSPFG